ncbi:hypothetical protein Mgra_00000453 [Meloidogyne graminicola]|uniref:K Homology domain-containing protein n=1 Tax=Meloidogyne graminicola TaxID=189291 RepID=A0A8T0A3M8_9BILA|nr:hypothetical protein Mgra_00000453 [Meloidogyne graminicola]
MEEQNIQNSNIEQNINKNKFSTMLGDQIYEICLELKIKGKEIEQTNKDKLDKFFISLRLASCRENGELGLPCRIKILELLELRLMGWRTNLSYCKYYARKEREFEELIKKDEFGLTRTSSSINSSPNSISSTKYLINENKQNLIPNITPKQQQNLIENNSGLILSSPPIFSTQFNIPPPPTIQSPPTTSYLFNSQFDKGISSNPSTAFIFVPSTIPPTFVPTGNLINFSSPPPLFNSFSSSTFYNYSTSELELIQPKIKNTSNIFREEINIRNSDSGKVMGVKGRRVALIEELSNTVISFQKVEPKCQNRQLTIIAEDKNFIELAKSLISETIERNTSPDRKSVKNELMEKTSHLTKDIEKDISKIIDIESKIKIIRENDDILKIASNDVSLLNLAQEAINLCLKQINIKLIESSNNKINQQKQIKNKNIITINENSFTSQNVKYVYDRNTLLELREKLQNKGTIMEEAYKHLKNNELDIFC